MCSRALQRASGDEAVDAGPNGKPGAPGGAIEVYGLLEYTLRDWRLYERE
jgi:hypothetical protein